MSQTQTASLPPRRRRAALLPSAPADGPWVRLSQILLGLAEGQDWHAQRLRAEHILLALAGEGGGPELFAGLARQWSDCPSAAQGGDMGWLRAQDCVPELANELFEMREPAWGMGLHPRLVHSEQGFHIVCVQGRRQRRPRPAHAHQGGEAPPARSLSS